MSNDLWTTQFGSDLTLVGRDTTLDGRRYTVVGVMPPRFASRHECGGGAAVLPARRRSTATDICACSVASPRALHRRAHTSISTSSQPHRANLSGRRAG